MKVIAPGKLLFTGAYAVLEGAPAIVVAVDRFVVADPSGAIDTRALYDGPNKLGLGSSAASLVARFGLQAALHGEDLASDAARNWIVRKARETHELEQPGGSGVDIAASTYGGVLSFAMGRKPRPSAMPPGLCFETFWSGTSARTTDMRARVDAFRARDPQAFAVYLDPLVGIATRAAGAFEAGDTPAFLSEAVHTGLALEALGRACDAPIVPARFAELGALAEAEGGAFFPSGAGGGDIAVFLGQRAPSAAFLAHAAKLNMQRLGMLLDRGGVRIEGEAS